MSRGEERPQDSSHDVKILEVVVTMMAVKLQSSLLIPSFTDLQMNSRVLNTSSEEPGRRHRRLSPFYRRAEKQVITSLIQINDLCHSLERLQKKCFLCFVCTADTQTFVSSQA